MKKYIIYSLLLLSGIFYSCEEEVDPDVLLTSKPRLLSINSTLSPQDEIIKVLITKSISITQVSKLRNDPNISSSIGKLVEEAESVLNAEVFINEENEAPVQLSFSRENLAYIISSDKLPIKAEKKYFLKVIFEGKTYRAHCKIPKEKVNIEDIEGSFVNEKGEVKETTLLDSERLKISLDDIEGEDNYYIFGTNTLGGNTFIFNSYEGNSEQFISDNLLDGKRLTTIAYRNFTSNSSFSVDNTPSVTIQVANAEKLLFDSLRLEALNRENLGDPFIEQAILPTNIEGENAVGIFAGYQLTEKEVLEK